MESPDQFYPLDRLPQRPSVADKALDTGWWELDQIFKFYPGQFVVITGIAGHGKSTFMLNLLPHLARKHGIGSFLYVPENESHIRDKISLLYPHNGDPHKATFADFAARQCIVLSSTPADYREQPRDLYWVLEQAHRAVVKHRVELVMVDPWNELERVKPKDQSMPEYITECLMWIKQFCRSTNCIFVMVAHPTKDVREASGGFRKPGLADIEGSMAWMNKCDNGLVIWREPEREGEPERNECKVLSAKVREIGAGKRGSALFNVDPNTGIFTPQYGAVNVGFDFDSHRSDSRGYRKDKNGN
jgi:twinkle protein